MQVQSLAFRTDLALLELGGSSVTDHGDHLVVRSPDNPTFWWGNFLLLAAPPAAADLDGWLATFAREFPGAWHVALGFDGTEGISSDAGVTTLVQHLTSAARGFTVDASTVMTATTVHPPPRPATDADLRVLAGDDDWAQSVEVRMACDAEGYPEAGHLGFVEARAATARALTRAGHGSWFGAFLQSRLVSQLGLVQVGTDLARFQSVETHPDFRGRGLAGALVHHASVVGLRDHGAQTLVMVADPDYPAIRLYRSVGFADTETQLQTQRRPADEVP